MTRLQKIGAGLAILQLALVAWAFWPDQDNTAAGEPLLAEVAFDGVVQVEIEAATGETVTLEQSQASGNWVHVPSGYPLTDGIVDKLIEGLAQIKADRLVTQTPASHSRLQVADGQFRAKVVLTADEGIHELLVGTAPNSRSVHVRLPGRDEVWLTNAITDNDVTVDLRNWMNTLYYAIERNDVVALTVENGNGRFEFVQATPAAEDENGNFVAATWALTGLTAEQQLDLEAFNQLLSQATSIRFAEPLADEAIPSYRLDAPTASVTIQLENGERNLLIGTYESQSDSYVVGSDFGPIVRVPSSAVNYFVEATEEGLVFQP